MHPQVTFRGLFPSESAVQEVWQRAEALQACRPDISACHVCIERVSQRNHRPRFRVTVLLSSEPSGTAFSGRSEPITCDDLSKGLAEAFVAARRVFLEPPLSAAGGV
ncbi:MAG TPA: hypothetical protein VFN67_01765 [Polyangiales bacterium]|nr:hypothetical protein [Polyangiales bacterium]